MARLQYRSISKRTVDSLSVEDKDAVVWDRELSGFGVRVYPSGTKVYLVQTRFAGKSTRIALGRHGVISADQARRKAALAIARIKAGEEPEAPAAATAKEPTFADLAERHLREHVEVRCKPRTAEAYQWLVGKFVLPELGKLTIGAVGRQHIAALHLRHRDTPYQANRILEVVRKMFNLAEAWGLRPDGTNPCRFVQKYKEQKRERFLTEVGFRQLGQVLNEVKAEGSETVCTIAAIRLLMLTGCRLSEIQTLRWEDVDLDTRELRLRESKTGARMVPLSDTAIRVLNALPRQGDNSWVIVGRKPGSHLTDLQHPWRRIWAQAGLDDVRIHDLRHSFASRALALGESLPMIGKLLGHTQVQTTARYAHLAGFRQGVGLEDRRQYRCRYPGGWRPGCGSGVTFLRRRSGDPKLSTAKTVPMACVAPSDADRNCPTREALADT